MLKTNKSRNIYISIIGGKFTVKTDKADSQAILRINKNGQEVWERHYDTVTGTIKNIEHETTEYGDNLVLTLNDTLETYILKLPKYSRLENGFLQRLPNIDLTKEIDLENSLRDKFERLDETEESINILVEQIMGYPSEIYYLLKNFLGD